MMVVCIYVGGRPDLELSIPNHENQVRFLMGTKSVSFGAGILYPPNGVQKGTMKWARNVCGGCVWLTLLALRRLATTATYID